MYDFLRLETPEEGVIIAVYDGTITVENVVGTQTNMAGEASPVTVDYKHDVEVVTMPSGKLAAKPRTIITCHDVNSDSILVEVTFDNQERESHDQFSWTGSVVKNIIVPEPESEPDVPLLG